MHGSRREATPDSRASTRRAAAEASRRPYSVTEVSKPSKCLYAELYVNREDAGGGTRITDTRIMIPRVDT